MAKIDTRLAHSAQGGEVDPLAEALRDGCDVGDTPLGPHSHPTREFAYVCREVLRH